MKSVLGFWLDRGIDGVRVDAISHLIEDDNLLDEPLSHNPEASNHNGHADEQLLILPA